MVFFPGLWIKELIIKIVKRQYHMQMKSKKSHVVAFQLDSTAHVIYLSNQVKVDDIFNL